MRFPDDVPTLTAGDVTLRAHRVDDVDGIVEQCVDPVSIEHTTLPLGYDREMGKRWVTQTIPEVWQDDREWIFAIESTHPDGHRRFSGSLSLRDEGERRAEIAFGAHPAIRGRGVMTAAVELLLDYGFDARELETVVWYAHAGNLASRRIAWKTGFTFGGTLRRWLPQRGVYRDGWVATLHRDDARAPRGPWHDAPVIEDERVRLRPMREADVGRVTEACQDPLTRQWIPGLPDPYTADDALQFIRATWDMSVDGRPLWAVADPGSDDLLAVVGIPRRGPSGLELGYWTHPAARGKGVMTAAVAMTVRHVFLDASDGGMGAHRVFAATAVANDASRHVLQANGFAECGVEHDAEAMADGSYADLVVLELPRSSWRAASRSVV